MEPIKIQSIKNQADERGDKFFLPQEAIEFVGHIDEMHYVSVLPGAIRGNHYHIEAKEFVLLTYSDSWQFMWQACNRNNTITQNFTGEGSVLILIESRVVHTINNTGKTALHLISCSNKRHNPQKQETFRKVLIS